ncbi:MAG: Penicillin acylase [Frankiales bacterium]|nr:Penicillin acylase [Frankiales bacterium]
MRRRTPLAVLLAGVTVTALAVPGSAAGSPGYLADSGGFRSVLSYGQGETTDLAEVGAHLATGAVPESFTDQAGLYNAGIAGSDPTKLYKDASFLPESAGGALTSPREGVRILRDETYEVPRIYGDTRADTMFGAGYAVAQDRLFFMDVLRRTAEGRLSGLLGPDAAAGDSAALGTLDLSPEELTSEVRDLPRVHGAEGARALQDLEDYVDGVNAYIDAASRDPRLLPGEYPALGATPEEWTLADTAATGYLLIGQFTAFGGGETQQSMILAALQKKLGAAKGAQVYADLRRAEDPETTYTTPQRFPSDDPGPVDPRARAVVDPGSYALRDAVAGSESSSSSAALPAWAKSLATEGLGLERHASNAVLVAAKHSASGKPLAVTGPQVGYYSPQILVEQELHAPGVHVRGMNFPGAGPYPLIGHGLDFSWTGTSAFGDNVDTFAEQLCNPDGTAATKDSRHYRYRGACVPFSSREQRVPTPASPTAPRPPGEVVLTTLRSVHGPVQGFGTVGGKPVALTFTSGVYKQAISSLVAFQRLAENRVNSPQSFERAMRAFTGNENWFYNDSASIGWLQSGRFPMRTRGVDLDVPTWGTGAYDWQAFDPATFSYRSLPPTANPRAIDPPQGYLVSWNNKAAPGWKAPPGVWSYGSSQRSSLLELPLKGRIAKGTLGLADVAKVNVGGGTRDLRGYDVLPQLLAVLGTPSAQDKPVVDALRAWQRSGAHRRSVSGGESYDQSAAVLAFDAWWPKVVKGVFEPTLGADNLSRIGSDELLPLDAAPTAQGFFGGWQSQVKGDLRRVLGQTVRGGQSRTYCGGGDRARCRSLLLAGLRAAVAEVAKAEGTPDLKAWTKPVLCPDAPGTCDAITPTAAGAVETPQQPWQNRGSYQQATEIRRRAPRS